MLLARRLTDDPHSDEHLGANAAPRDRLRVLRETGHDEQQHQSDDGPPGTSASRVEGASAAIRAPADRHRQRGLRKIQRLRRGEAEAVVQEAEHHRREGHCRSADEGEFGDARGDDDADRYQTIASEWLASG